MDEWMVANLEILVHSFIIYLIIINIPSSINPCSSMVEQWIFTRCWFNPSHGSYEDGWDHGWDHQPIHLILHLLYHKLIHLNLAFLCCFCIVFVWLLCLWLVRVICIWCLHCIWSNFLFFTLTKLTQTFGFFVGSTNFTAGLLPKQERILQCANSIAIP